MIPALLVAVLAAAPPPQESAPLRRFALVVGANDGGPARVRLRYATSDAEAFAKVLGKLGGVADLDRELVLEPDVAALRASLARVSKRVAESKDPKTRTELVVYYSGHSDEQGLLLRGERLGYADLRRWLESTSADVRIAIVDSCSSGALTRGKGGARVAPFLVDASSSVRGHAFLTSSSADEASQESDRIGASFFTHYLVSGLRGAADVTRDRRITLNEAYQFAFQETLARTESTRSGPQHPAYEIQLVGTGDLVMTDLRGTGAALVLTEGDQGRFFVRDAGGRLVAELRKFAGRSVELGLEPGPYVVTREAGGSVSELQLELAEGDRAELTDARFKPVTLEATAARGDAPTSEQSDAPEKVSLLSLALVPGWSTAEGEAHHFSFGLLGARSRAVYGLGLASIVHLVDRDVVGLQLAGVVDWAGGELLGVQLAGVAAGARGNVTGGQVGGVLSFGGGDVLGAQLAGVASLSRGRLTGLQASGVASVAESGTGVQLAGVVNLSTGAFTGVQLSGTANVSTGRLVGVQLGTLNAAQDLEGVQVATVNVAKKARGFQLGVVNVADELDGEAIGIVSVIGNGRLNVEVLGGETALASAGLRLGSRRVQTVFTLGALGRSRWSTGIGLAYHLAGDRLFADIDVLGQSVRQGIDPESENVWGTVRLLGGYQLRKHVAVVVGPTFNVYLPVTEGQPAVGFGPTFPIRVGRRSATGWFGVAAGLRI